VNWRSEFCIAWILRAVPRRKITFAVALDDPGIGKCTRFCWRRRSAQNRLARFVLILSIPALLSVSLAAKEKEKLVYGEGLIVNIPLPESEVEPVVEQVAENGVIRGTKEYNKDEYIAGAIAADAPHVFQPWTEAGKVFYKVRLQALDPRNFKETNDSGTLEVRYVVAPQGEKNTVLRIDALFEEDFRHAVHPSNGSVETSEYKDIREHLDEIEVMKKQDAEAQAERQEMIAKKQGQVFHTESPSASSSSVSSPQVNAGASESSMQPVAQDGQGSSNNASQSADSPVQLSQPATAETSPSQDPDLQTLEERVQALRKEVSRVVKSPGAPLKSAPFHTANTLQLLATGTEVLIVVDTPYWYGVETHEGQHGWIMRDELEQRP
jgi:polyhydroxyalkanoate synthesis regulator phasin